MRRRTFLRGSGSLAAAFLCLPRAALAAPVVEISMAGRPDGSLVWFDPQGVLIRPGQTVRWVNRDSANAHTATAYHPQNFERVRRIPAGAAPFDSDYLLPGDRFEVRLAVPGVYDYYCVPHEMSGMVGRIVVAEPGQTGFADYGDTGDLPRAALDGFAPIADILARGAVRREEG